MTKDCYFCKGIQKEIDHRDTDTLSKFLSASAKIIPARRNKCCPKHQRILARTIKRSRQAGLLPYIRR